MAPCCPFRCRPLLIAVLRVVLTSARLNGPSVPRKLRYRTSSEAKTRVAGPELPLLASQNQQSVSFSVGAAAGVFSVGTAGLATAVVSLAALPSSLGEVCPVADDGGVSKLPRMIGKPSLALPMITTFELLDCAS